MDKEIEAILWEHFGLDSKEVSDGYRQETQDLAQALSQYVLEARIEELETQFISCKGWMNTSFEREITERIATLKKGLR